jgi:altronate hydrolase
MKYNLYLTYPEDNTGVVLQPIKKGETLSAKAGVTIIALDDIPENNKVAVADIGRGDSVKKYGEVIGVAGEDIKAGRWVHTHNIKPEGAAL